MGNIRGAPQRLPFLGKFVKSSKNGASTRAIFFAFGTLAAAMAVVEAALGRSRVAIYAWPLMVDYMTSSCMSDAATGAGSCGRIPIHLHSAREITRFPMSVSLPRMDKKDLKYCCNMLHIAFQQNLIKSTSST